jgi:hypothetical protein
MTSFYEKYLDKYSDRNGKLIENIYKLDDEIRNIKVKGYKLDFNNLDLEKKVKDLAFSELKKEIRMYFQYNNGSLGFDIAIIISILKKLLILIFVITEEKLKEDEINNCKLEIAVEFYFFTNCIYNFREKIKEFFRIKYFKKNREFLFSEETILDKPQEFLKILIENFNKLEEYCSARNSITHGIYEIIYNNRSNKIKVIRSKFNLSRKNIITKNNDFSTEIILEDLRLIEVVEEMQKIRKKIICYLLDLENNINENYLIEKFSQKIKKGKKYSFIDNTVSIIIRNKSKIII